jgi:hypothetical protein
MSRVPAMVWFEGGGDTDNIIRWSEANRLFSHAFQWSDAQVFDDRRTSRAPAIAGDGNDTYMAWKGPGADPAIWWSRLHGSSLTAGGAAWSPQKPANFIKTSTFPALGQLGDRTFLVFRHEELSAFGHPTYSIRWTELHGDRWDESTLLLDSYSNVDENVSLAQHEGDGCLHMVWRDVSDSKIYWSIFDGTTWDSQGPLKNWTTSAVPTVTSDGINLHFAWRRVEDNHIGWSTRIGGHLRDEVILYDRRTSGAPALGRADQGEVVMVWRGAEDSVLWWARYSALKWEPQYYPFTDRHTDVWHGVGLA